jgi:hypothetical protein
MQFDENEIQELAKFFSRRFPEADQRQRMASAAGFSDGFDDWEALLCQAQATRRLSRLADVSASAAPDDDNLRDVCTILMAPRRRRRVTMAVSSAVVVALGVVLGLGVYSTAPVPVEEPAAVLASADVNPPPAPVQEAPRPAQAPPEVEPMAAPPVEAPAVVAEEVPEPEPTGSDTEAPELAPSPFAASAPLTGRCRAKTGALIGYWYAGATAPGGVGAAVEVPVTVNVRADFPDVHNDFNARAPVRCVLLQGDRVVLSGEPIQVPGDRYWVPLYGGDRT